MTSGMTRLEFPTKQELSKRRQKIEALLKKAIKGNLSAKEKLLDEYSIKVYSSSEKEKYEQTQGGKVRNLPLNKGTSGIKRQPVKSR